MTDCARISQDLSLYWSDDLDPSRRERVEAHVRVCPSCAAEAADYEAMALDLRSLLQTEGALPEARIGLLARRAADAAVQAPWWRRLAPPVPAHGWGAAVPAMLLMVVVAAPFLLSRETARTVPPAPVKLDMQLEGSEVKVAWSNGQHRSYKIFKTSDPRLLGSVAPQIVRGHEWVDRNPGSSTIVYYRVE